MLSIKYIRILKDTEPLMQVGKQAVILQKGDECIIDDTTQRKTTSLESPIDVVNDIVCVDFSVAKKLVNESYAEWITEEVK